MGDDDDLPEPDDPLLAALAATPSAEVLPRRTLIDGQYRIERVLGEGGMGVVYLARDIRLDREVAIKVGIEHSATSIARLAREALALARLSHPNVVVLHEIGELDGRSYVAMEYVAGGTARAWCKGRKWREIVALYVAAGEGLAAAHAAGLVHRDFKPDNVLVGADGRPRVADFGLARDESDDKEATAPGAGGIRAGSATKTGAFAGTPAYMAPEQFARGALDARADQFSFCASLWEALFGERPFGERGDGTVPEPRRPARTPVPRHLEAALRRGMRANRDERWPNLEPLLAELRRDPARRRLQLAIGAGVLVLAAAAGAAVYARGHTEDSCDGGAAQIASTWSSARAAAVHAAIAPPGAPDWIEQTASHVTADLDAWAARWATHYRAVCVARRGSWSSQLSDRGVECLAQRQRDLAATIDVLASTKGIAPRASQIVDSLGTTERCADPAYLSTAVPPPSDPVKAQHVATELEGLAKIRAMTSAGQITAARELSLSAFTRAQALGVPSLIARAQMTRGSTAMMVGDNKAAFDDLHDAYFVARDAKDPSTAATAAATAALALLNMSRDAEAPDWARLGGIEGAASADPDIEAQAANSLAAVALNRNDTEHALVYAEQGVAIRRRTLGALPAALRMRAQVLDRVGRFEEALADDDEAIRIVEQRYADRSPLVGEIESERALVLLHLQRPDDAVAAARHAVAVTEATMGSDSEPSIMAIGALGTTLKDAGKLDQALPLLDRTLEWSRATYGMKNFNTASAVNDRAELLKAMGRYDDAIAGFRESIALFTDVEGPKGYEVGLVQFNVADCLYGAGRLGEVGPAIAASLPALGSAPDSPIYAEAQILVGVGQAYRGEYAQAKTTVEAAITKLEPGDNTYRARGHVELARVAHALGDDATARSDVKTALTETDDKETRAAAEQFQRTLK